MFRLANLKNRLNAVGLFWWVVVLAARVRRPAEAGGWMWGMTRQMRRSTMD
jgi:hypothetical protein